MKARKNIGWKLILIGWTIYGIIMSVESYVIRERLGRPVSWIAAFAGDMSYTAVWIVLTPIVLWFVRKYPMDKQHLAKRLTLHIVMSFVFALTHKAIHNLVTASYNILFEGGTFSWELQYRNMLSYFDYGIQLYWIILLLDYAYEYYTRFQEKELVASRLETALANAQLSALKSQLQPHFLFNTLNAISVLIQESPKAATVMLGQLSDLLRLTLEHVQSQEIPLKQEMEFLDRYLEIQQTRFGDRLTVRENIDKEITDAYVPTMILQPLVENALRHGIGTVPGPGILDVSAVRNNGMIELRVRDTGPGMKESSSDSQRSGLGLHNTQSRLQQLYGDEHRLDISSPQDGGFQVTIMIPYHTKPIFDSSAEENHQ